MFRSFSHITNTGLYVEANEPSLGMRRTRLSLQYCVKLMSNEVNLAYSAVFQSDCVATCEAKERDIQPLGLRIWRHGSNDFHLHVLELPRRRYFIR